MQLKTPLLKGIPPWDLGGSVGNTLSVKADKNWHILNSATGLLTIIKSEKNVKYLWQSTPTKFAQEDFLTQN